MGGGSKLSSGRVYIMNGPWFLALEGNGALFAVMFDIDNGYSVDSTGY